MTPAQRAFDALGLAPFAFQTEVWQAVAQGRSGLLNAGTGTGKTYAIWGGLLNRLAQGADPLGAFPQILWITPMRALAADTARALQRFADIALPGLRVALRTGDTPTAERARQDRMPPQALVTTPESLSLLLSKPQGLQMLAGVTAVVADEWHELLGNKRGVQLQLCLAALARGPCPPLVWGLSATLGNLSEAAAALCHSVTAGGADAGPCLVTAQSPKPLQIATLLPAQAGRFPWAGHLGLTMRDQVVQAIEASASTLVFTNTRSQAELWYQALLEARPEWAGLLALHHGSLDKEVRVWVETATAQGALKAVVATSSLDLGVDFAPVDQVIQIGSPKGIARLMQRAGRSGHQPGKTSRLLLVPTHALEILESYAVQQALTRGRMESRLPPHAPMDVLVQHLATRVLGCPMDSTALYAEVRLAYSYRQLSRLAFDWAIDFLARGGASLTAYPDFHRLQLDAAGRWQLTDSRMARRHRLSIGTIVSDASMRLAWASGGGLGQIEESFIGRLKPGDTFLFAGRALELVRVKDLTAYVRVAAKKAGAVPRWNGGNMPLSTELSATVRGVLTAVRADLLRYPVQPPEDAVPEIQALWPLLRTQAERSWLPAAGDFLIERYDARDGAHCFLYPFAGRTVHLGLATLLGFRLSQGSAISLSYAVNDYGLALLVPKDQAAALSAESLRAALFRPGDCLAQDLLDALQTGGLAQRRFREIARVAGLVFAGPPGAEKTSRQFAASSNLFYEVFQKYDPENALYLQSWQEVQREECNIVELSQAIDRCQSAQWRWMALSRPSPFSFPLMVERLREQLSTEKLADRVARMLQEAQSES